MAELRKRLNSGWVLMDAIVNKADDSIVYFLERSKHRCIVKVYSDRHGEVIK